MIAPARVFSFAHFVLVLALLVSPASLAAARRTPDATPPPSAAVVDAIAIPGGETVRVDGRHDEAVWSRATPITDFVQRDPSEGAPSTHATDVRVVFDHASLYVAVHAADPDEGAVVGHLTRRDEESPSDWVRILVDSFRDRRTAYEFAVNAAGVKQDRYWFNDRNHDPGWDAVWDSAVSRDRDGWRAEVRIPFSQLRFNREATSAFGFAVVRNIQHANETATWPLLARSASGYVSEFGELRGLDFEPAQKRLELSPYVLAGVETSPAAAANPLVSDRDSNLAAGLDLKFQVAPGFTLTGTVNPDFGQVEADPAVVNLGAFETFFAERRPFFVEGSGNFSFDVDCNDGQCTGLFYSRRVGRAPQRVAPAPEGGYAAQPTRTTILGAAKLTGRVGGYTMGALTAVTSREDARLAPATGPGAITTAVEPATSYTVARLSREFAGQSRLSFMLTNTSRRLADELRFLPRSAVTGGVDGDWRLGGGRYSLTGFWAGSRVAGSADAIARLQRSNVHSFQRPDAGHLTYDPTRTSMAGHAGAMNVSKIGGSRTRFQSHVSYKSPGFEINDLGFQQRADEINQSNWFQLRDETPGRWVRTVNVNVNQWSGYNFDGDRRYAGANVNAHWTLLTNWSFGGGVNYNARGLADRWTRGGPGAYTSPNLNGWVYLNTDNRRLVAGSLNYNFFVDPDRSRTWSISPGVTVRPNGSLAMALHASINRARRDAQWVQNLDDEDGPHYVFGRLDQTTVAISARVNYTLSPTLTLQLYGQPFVSAGGYDRFRELVDGRAEAYDDRYAAFDYGGTPDFTFLSFRTTNVLRWEYQPGSALFVVWQQGREDVTADGRFRLGRDLGDAFAAPATNVFLVKISRWLNF